MPDAEFEQNVLATYGDSKQNRKFFEQCLFMRKIVQDLRKSGYLVTAARTIREAKKEISRSDFDLAIVDLGWYMDASVPAHEKDAAAGWSLCESIDRKDQAAGRRTPQIVFSSHFAEDPKLSLRAATSQKLPIFKNVSGTCLNSLVAAVGFVESSLAAHRSTYGSGFTNHLEEITLGVMREPLNDYRRWTFLTLVCVSASLALLAAGVILVYHNHDNVPISVLTSVTSLVSSTVGALLYRRLASAQNALTNLRKELVIELRKRDSLNTGRKAAS
jgi:hypothetical protein